METVTEAVLATTHTRADGTKWSKEALENVAAQLSPSGVLVQHEDLEWALMVKVRVQVMDLVDPPGVKP